MILNEDQIQAQSHEARVAWLDALDDRGRLIVFAPRGWKWTLVVVAHAKRLLQANMPVETRLKILEGLERCEGDRLTDEVLAAVDPMPDAGEEIIREAMTLGPKQALDIYARHEVFTTLATINPSLLTAIELASST